MTEPPKIAELDELLDKIGNFVLICSCIQAAIARNQDPAINAYSYKLIDATTSGLKGIELKRFDTNRALIWLHRADWYRLDGDEVVCSPSERQIFYEITRCVEDWENDEEGVFERVLKASNRFEREQFNRDPKSYIASWIAMEKRIKPFKKQFQDDYNTLVSKRADGGSLSQSGVLSSQKFDFPIKLAEYSHLGIVDAHYVIIDTKASWWKKLVGKHITKVSALTPEGVDVYTGLCLANDEEPDRYVANLVFETEYIPLSYRIKRWFKNLFKKKPKDEPKKVVKLTPKNVGAPVKKA